MENAWTHSAATPRRKQEPLDVTVSGATRWFSCLGMMNGPYLTHNSCLGNYLYLKCNLSDNCQGVQIHYSKVPLFAVNWNAVVDFWGFWLRFFPSWMVFWKLPFLLSCSCSTPRAASHLGSGALKQKESITSLSLGARWERCPKICIWSALETNCDFSRWMGHGVMMTRSNRLCIKS